METLVTEILPVVIENYEFEAREKLLKRIFVEISEYQDSDTTNKINDFSSECYSTSDRMQIRLLMEDFKHVDAEENNFEK